MNDKSLSMILFAFPVIRLDRVFFCLQKCTDQCLISPLIAAPANFILKDE